MNRSKAIFAVAIVVMLGLFLTGCSGSEETQQAFPEQPSATEVMLQKQVSDLKNETQSLKQQNEQLQQELRTARSRIAELETQLAEISSKPTIPVASPPPVRRAVNAESAYEQGLSLFRSRNYAEALSTFQSILAGDAGEYEDLSIYWSGECNYALKNYHEAIENFQRVLGYRHSTKKDDAQFMLGQVYFAMGEKAKAREEYQKLIDKYPASEYVKRAKARLNQM